MTGPGFLSLHSTDAIAADTRSSQAWRGTSGSSGLSSADRLSQPGLVLDRIGRLPQPAGLVVDGWELRSGTTVSV